jgi:hypothetical protein
MSESDDERLQQAKALVSSLTSLEWKVKSLTEELERTKAREDGWRKSYWMVNAERNEWFKRRWAVDNLHSESQRSTCGDGCCSEGTGTCSYCKEPYPCRTIQALDNEPEDWPQPPADDPPDRPLVKELTK